MREIETYLKEDSNKIHEASLNNHGVIEDGVFYEYNVGNFMFGCVLQKLTSDLKVTFYFFDGLTEEEEWYWTSNSYHFRLSAGSNPTDYNHTLAVMRLKNIEQELPIKAIMFKYLDTLYKFKRDFKFVVMMLRSKPYGDLITQAIKKNIRKSATGGGDD
jgi:hypothetical protein